MLDLLSIPYLLATSVRNALFDRGLLPTYRSQLAVICIGNLSVGGNGKTPLVEYTVGRLTALGHKPVVLSRGYGGKTKGPYLVKKSDSAAQVGDEPALLASALGAPVVVARSRVEGARFIEKEELGNVIVLDDGYQHRYLHRDLNIVCIYCGNEAAVDGHIQGRLLPLGRFRERKSEGYRRASAIVLNSRCASWTEEHLRKRIMQELPPGLPVFSTKLSAHRLQDSSGNTLDPVKSPVYAFSGLANPDAFLLTLQQLGYAVAGHASYSDHHIYTETEIGFLRSEARGAPLVCSVKDYVKIPPEMRESIYILATHLELDKAIVFDSLLEAAKKKSPVNGNRFKS